MKRTLINKLAMVAGLTVGLAVATTTASGQAPEKGSAKGGASLLMKPIPAVSLSEYVPMSCAKCKDVTIARRDTDTRGLGAKTQLTGSPPIKLVPKHLCEGCGTDWAITGHGKARTTVASHKCTGCGAADLACCNTTKGADTANKGMEKKFELAPLK